MTIATTEREAPPTAVVDRYGRRLRYVRVSVTDVCNLSCQYCNPVQGCASLHPHKLSWDDLDFLVDVCANELGVEAIRVTGGGADSAAGDCGVDPRHPAPSGDHRRGDDDERHHAGADGGGPRGGGG
jgi:hypothetical protein